MAWLEWYDVYSLSGSSIRPFLEREFVDRTDLSSSRATSHTSSWFLIGLIRPRRHGLCLRVVANAISALYCGIEPFWSRWSQLSSFICVRWWTRRITMLTSFVWDHCHWNGFSARYDRDHGTTILSSTRWNRFQRCSFFGFTEPAITPLQIGLSLTMWCVGPIPRCDKIWLRWIQFDELATHSGFFETGLSFVTMRFISSVLAFN
jgi:hypothetical protein